MAIYEIPLRGGTAQRLKVMLAGKLYTFALAFIDEEEGGWVLDLGEEGGTPLVSGIALLPGQDLLEPFPELGIGVRLAIVTPGDPNVPPTFAGLGSDSKLLFTVA